MGNELFEKVVRLSGLPEDIIKKELTEILKKEGIHPDQITEPALRKILMRYLRDVLIQHKVF